MKNASFSIYSDAKSPFWLAQMVMPDGSRLKRSTKVPVEGGLFQGERLSKPQAKRRALLVAQMLATQEEEKVEDGDGAGGDKSREVHAVYLRPTTEQLRQVVHALPEV